jgi:hypothetical protein
MKKFEYQDVVARYGANILGEEVVFYPSNNCKKLVVCFSAMDAKNKFNRLSWFWDEEELWSDGVSFLYLCDQSYKYYLGDDLEPKFHRFEKIIKYFAQKNNLDKESIFAIGSSMGGYAAIFYAFRMGLAAAIVGVPQISKKYARMHNYSNWIKSINSVGEQWFDLDEYLYRTDLKLPALYIEYGSYPADELAAEKLIDIYKYRGGKCIFRKFLGDKHEYFMSKSTVNSAVSFFSEINNDLRSV